MLGPRRGRERAEIVLPDDLPQPSNSTSLPGQSSSTPSTAVSGPTNPFQAKLAAACGDNRGEEINPEASSARDFGCKSNGPARIGIFSPSNVERLYAERVAREHEPPLGSIPPCDSEHVTQPLPSLPARAG